MNKQVDFQSIKESRTDEKIKRTLQQEFELPEVVAGAKNQAFEEVRQRAAQTPKRAKRRQSRLFRTAGTAAAAFVLFSGVCVANPEIAKSIPFVGHVFEEIGNSLGFSGDYSKYAEPLTEPEMKDEGGEVLYSKTVDGVTVTLSEVYCNDTALSVSMLIQSEEPIPETMMFKNSPYITAMYSEISFSYNDSFRMMGDSLDGKLLDDHTYAGVLRLNLEQSRWEEDEEGFRQAFDAFIKENNLTEDATEEELQAVFGVSEVTEKNLKELGGPNYMDYRKEVEIPEQFTMNLNIHKIIGALPEEMLTEEGRQEMGWTDANSWCYDGDWEFQVDVTKDTADSVVKELNLLDENGAGIISVLKTPFEISLNWNDPRGEYFWAVLDAAGEPLDKGKYGGAGNVYAIQDRDVSKIYVYLCDYDEYMDELKGYYWSEDYEEKKKTKTYKEFLDERSILHTEVVF